MNDLAYELLRKRVRWHEKSPFLDWNGSTLSISTFDHCLSEVEAAESSIMFYRLARECGAETEYLASEQRWLAFYDELSKGGAYIITPGSGRRTEVRGESGLLRRTIIDSLRERRLMNVVFNAYPLRALGGHDRTDLILPATLSIGEQVAEIARQNGLFVLP